jgi:lantibiotic modifying enzyme
LEAGEGVNTGTAGVLLGLLALDQCSGRGDFRADVAAGAAALAERAPQAAAHGLFTGNAGAALALAVAGRRQDRPDWIAAAHDRLRAGAAGCGDHDLFGGAAGVLWAACLVAEALDDPAAAELAAGCADRLIATATLDQGLRVWPADEPAAPAATGAAHGSAGIALALAAWGRLARQPAAAALARDTFVRIFKHGRVSRGQTLRRAVDGSAAPALSWCHGIAGHLWCLLLAYGDDPALRQPIDWSVRRLAAATAISSPVYCHGLAGELELWRLVACVPRHRELARRRAASAAAALRLQAQRRDGCCVWGSERPEVVTPDLWVGFLGPATALALHAAGATDALLSGPWLRACARTAHARPS